METKEKSDAYFDINLIEINNNIEEIIIKMG